MSKSKFKEDTKVSASSVEEKVFTANADLIKDVASIPFSPVVGLEHTGIRQRINNTSYVGRMAPFGLQVLKVIPTIGSAAHSNSAATIAAKAIFASNRRPNSGSVNYEAPDYLMYHIAVCEAYALVRHYARVYGLFSLYNDRSRILPDRVIEECGVGVQLANDLPALRALLNRTIDRLNSLNIYGGFPVGASWMSAFQDIYADSKDPKASLTVIVPRCIHVWNGTKAITGSALLAADLPFHTSVASIAQTLDEVIRPLMEDQDIAIMSGDTFKAFPESLYKMGHIAEDYHPNIVYSPEFLTEIENMESINEVNSLGDYPFAIFQDAEGNVLQTITYANTYGSRAVVIPETHLYNLHWNNPQPKDIVLASRFKACLDKGSCRILRDGDDDTAEVATINAVFAVACADFVVAEYKVFQSAENESMLVFTSEYINTTEAQISQIKGWLYLSVLDWHPICTLLISDDTEVIYYGDLDNFSWIDDTSVRDVLDAMTLSMLGVPVMSQK